MTLSDIQRIKNDYVFTLRYTSEQVCLMCNCWVDCRVHGAWSMTIDSAGVDRIIGTVESTSVCQPPQLTSVKHMHTTVVHWTHTKNTVFRPIDPLHGTYDRLQHEAVSKQCRNVTCIHKLTSSFVYGLFHNHANTRGEHSRSRHTWNGLQSDRNWNRWNRMADHARK